MSKRGRKLYEDEPEPVSLSIGTYDSFTEIPKDDKPKRKRQIGFIRTKPKRRKPPHGKI